jgi:hypothetical protein
MATNALEERRIGPELALEDVTIPPHVGDRLAAFYDREERIEDARQWAEAADAAIRAETGRGGTEADMCTVEDGPHAVEFADDSQSYVCVLDPLIAVFRRGEPGTVRSETPEDGTEVTIDLDETGATVAPETAVVSLGVGYDAPDAEPTLEAAYGQVCASTDVFASAEEYERWADGVDASTTSYPVGRAVALTRELEDVFAG